jgi:hypothetical protein
MWVSAISSCAAVMPQECWLCCTACLQQQEAAVHSNPVPTNHANSHRDVIARESMQALCGQAQLTQCTVRRCGAGPAEQVMTPHRSGAVLLSGATTVDMQHCYVEVRVRASWTQVADGGDLLVHQVLPSFHIADSSCLRCLNEWISGHRLSGAPCS